MFFLAFLSKMPAAYFTTIIVSLWGFDRIVAHEGEFMRLGSRATESVRKTDTRRSEGWMPVNE